MSRSFTAGATPGDRAFRRPAPGSGGLSRSRMADLYRGRSVDEPESRFGRVDALPSLRARISSRLFASLGQSWRVPPPGTGREDAPAVPQSAEIRPLLLHRRDENSPAPSTRTLPGVGTEHLLASLLTTEGSSSSIPSANLLAGAGLDVAGLVDRLAEAEKGVSEPIPLDPRYGAARTVRPRRGDRGRPDPRRLSQPQRPARGSASSRTTSGLVLDDPGLTRRLKEVRHRLAGALRGFDPEMLLASRDVSGDVGTHIMTASEMARENPRAVLTANFKRTAEALRTLEEYGKLYNEWVAGRFEVLRYDVYTLEKLVLTAAASHRSLGDARLMVLVGGLPTLGTLTWVVGEALAGGADVIQLREKGLPDREWLTRAREVRILTAQAKARFVVNDRPDLARLAGADGVHLGQDDVTVRDARRVVGPNALIGVSTHDPEQLDKAVLDAAGYLGVGPVFASRTKGFDDLAGLGFVRHAAESTNLPWFAIGGIDESNIGEAIEAGARRVAVSSAVVRAEVPRQAAAALRARLDAAWG